MSTLVVMMIVPVKALEEHQMEANCCSLEVVGSLNILEVFENCNSKEIHYCDHASISMERYLYLPVP